MSVEIINSAYIRAVGTICDHVITCRTYGTREKISYLFLPTCRTYGTI